ncbi:unnamed protein product [Fraxinus pennsylvanica]|uniref:Uncharacterized protein n=1 Tax=Fraxinus pennsylvanica TaxID=56036 RepID=A0AAD2A2V7_9LAMI|nr:unnamed protein product [Fraxinus pennsylvanica]
MASNNLYNKILFFLLVISIILPKFSSATPRILALVKKEPPVLKHHEGTLLKGNVNVNLIWYGKFTSTQRSTILEFSQSLSHKHHRGSPPLSVASWWSTIAKYKGGLCIINVGNQVFDQSYSLGKSLKDAQIVALASIASGHVNGVNVVLMAFDVAVEDFCMNMCGSHGYIRGKSRKKYAYAWVGNSAIQCPGQCAWPFQKPIVGPQKTLLVAPNGDVRVDGMVINLARAGHGPIQF